MIKRPPTTKKLEHQDRHPRRALRQRLGVGSGVPAGVYWAGARLLGLAATSPCAARAAPLGLSPGSGAGGRHPATGLALGRSHGRQAYGNRRPTRPAPCSAVVPAAGWAPCPGHRQLRQLRLQPRAVPGRARAPSRCPPQRRADRRRAVALRPDAVLLSPGRGGRRRRASSAPRRGVRRAGSRARRLPGPSGHRPGVRRRVVGAGADARQDLGGPTTAAACSPGCRSPRRPPGTTRW